MINKFVGLVRVLECGLIMDWWLDDVIGEKKVY